MSESFARTALHIVMNDKPFKQIVTTLEWMVTTANKVLLLHPDHQDYYRTLKLIGAELARSGIGRLFTPTST